MAPSGYSYDYQTGNSYNWNSYGGNTTVYGMNPRTGSTWNQTIRPNGNMSGFDSQQRYWQYNRGSNTYMRSDGKICTGGYLSRLVGAVAERASPGALLSHQAARWLLRPNAGVMPRCFRASMTAQRMKAAVLIASWEATSLTTSTKSSGTRITNCDGKSLWRYFIWNPPIPRQMLPRWAALE
ncbi:MAG TPA: hypothetical protein VMN03_06280 [Burkholderiales bacterium]|nr:hypothetical protein [Burkholderiales bacterium]